MHPEQIRQRQIAFILLGGFSMTLYLIGILFILGRFIQIENMYVNYLIIFLAEFGFYCLALALYKQWVSRVMWFNQGFGILIFLTLFKIITSSIMLYFLLPLVGIFVLNIIGLLGMFARGFVIELAFIAMAAKIFETDIFQNKNDQKDSRIIDRLD